jgi:hypothetical protein
VVELSRLGAQLLQLSPFIRAEVGFRCGRIRLRVLGHDPIVKARGTRGIIRQR